ncbi:MAG: serine/threonine protein kinase, partial [Gemmatirosa sp.]|nr:serine/threonine protein kinase [Gemmatirosa sp.]
MPEHSTELPAGRRLGRYLVRRRLGAGGFARVYLAWDPDLEIEVAIKVPKPQLADDPGAIDRFRREATTAARLRHPNVVTVLTVGRLEQPFDGAPADTPYLVMDYLPETLTGRLAATPILPEPEWLRIGEEVARGLAYAHAQGVVHRDVKPDNILFGRHGEAVVTDFGIARAVIEGATPASRSIVVGTPEYFSPEQARGLPLDGRTDIYGLGVTLYRAATGTLPFTGP